MTIKTTISKTWQSNSHPHTETTEGIDKLLSLRYYARMRFTANLLPQLLRSPAPRVISCFAPGMEGMFLPDDLGLKRSYGMMLNMSHAAIMTDFFFETLATRNPSVSFLHVYPGNVITPEFDRAEFPPLLKLFVRYVAVPLIRPFTSGYEEVGERMVFHSRSAMYPPAGGGADGGGGGLETALLRVPEGLEVLKGVDGEVGSGAYCVSAAGDWIDNGKKLKALREKGTREAVWEHTLQVFAEATAK